MGATKNGCGNMVLTYVTVQKSKAGPIHNCCEAKVFNTAFVEKLGTKINLDEDELITSSLRKDCKDKPSKGKD